MTAEIAILNKTAVALATDSAVTISSGDSAQKIFDTADKLFELCTASPIGVMVYNGMQFMGVPLEGVVKNFRSKHDAFESVEDAAQAFLAFLNEVGRKAPRLEKRGAIRAVVVPTLERIDKTIRDRIFEKLVLADKPEKGGIKPEDVLASVTDQVLVYFEKMVRSIGKGQFYGDSDGMRFSKLENETIQEAIEQTFPNAEKNAKDRLRKLSRNLLKSSYMSASRAGVVFAGFGSRELFPTLISYEIGGVLCNRLKYLETSRDDIDREGTKAVVRPSLKKRWSTGSCMASTMKYRIILSGSASAQSARYPQK